MHVWEAPLPEPIDFEREEVPEDVPHIFIGGRLDGANEINGEYAPLPGKVNNHPIWKRIKREHPDFGDNLRRLLAGDQSLDLSRISNEDLDLPETQEPLYLFMDDMGHWCVAPTFIGGGRFVARCRPAFVSQSPHECTQPWTVFVNGKLVRDQKVRCYIRSEEPVPKAIQIIGGHGFSWHLNGIFAIRPGFKVANRAVFTKNDTHERLLMVLYFAQQIGRWTIVTLDTGDPLQKSTNSSVTPEKAPMILRAQSPLAWSCMSPTECPTDKPWSVARERAPENPSVRLGSPRGQEKTMWVLAHGLRVEPWSPEQQVPVQSASTPPAPHPVAHDPTEITALTISGHFGIHSHINGDYVRAVEAYNARPVFIRPATNAEVPVCLYFDTVAGRWSISLEVGGPVIARSAVSWRACSPVEVRGGWEVNSPASGDGADDGGGGSSTPVISPWQADTGITATRLRLPAVNPQFTIWSNGLPGKPQGHHQSLLCGDYACLETRHGLRPVFRRATPSEERVLYVCFDPTSGRWLVTIQSPFEGGTPESLGILARSAPSWKPLSPMEVEPDRWELSVSEEFRPASTFRLSSLIHRPSNVLGVQGYVPQRLVISGRQGRNNTLNGTYSLLAAPSNPEQQGRPCYRKDEKGFIKFLYFWPDTGHWYIGPDLHDERCLCKAGPGEWAALSPDQVNHKWEVVRNGKFEQDPHIKVAPMKKQPPRMLNEKNKIDRELTQQRLERELTQQGRSLEEMEAVVKRLIANDDRLERRRIERATVRARQLLKDGIRHC